MLSVRIRKKGKGREVRGKGRKNKEPWKNSSARKKGKKVGGDREKNENNPIFLTADGRGEGRQTS